MAIEIIVGNVGAGKTYYATYTIWEEIKKIYNAEVTGKPYKYTHILTNIEGIKPNKYVKLLKVGELIKLWEWELSQYKKWESKYSFSQVEEINFNNIPLATEKEEIISHFLNKQDNIREFKSLNDKILHHINIPSDLETAYINYIKPVFKKQGFTDCLIVIDEAHNFFKRLSGAKERLVSYHRHYDQDYIFITQELHQLNKKVTDIAQKTILARNPTLKGTKSFNYKIYSGGYISFRDNNLLERVRLKADPDIFRLYSSGSIKHQKSYLKSLLVKGVFPLFLIIIGIIAFLNFIKSRGLPVTPTHPKAHFKILKKFSKPPTQWKKITIERIGNFIIWNNHKYNAQQFLQALETCRGAFISSQRHFDSTISESYKLKDIKCLNMQLYSSGL